jgi:DNA/RNA endonuclease YhcR with UshA esterase domain
MRFTWDVFVPGEDLPRRLTTNFLLSEGEEITVDGRVWLVENVELIEADNPENVATGTVSIIALSDLSSP